MQSQLKDIRKSARQGARAAHAQPPPRTAHTEEDAVRAALEGTSWSRARVGAVALARLLKDTTDTKQVFFLGIVVNAKQVPRLIARIANDPDGARLLEEKPAIDGSTVARMRALPATTLGGAYARYLDDNGLDPDLFQAPPGLPQPLRFIAQRIRQTHDVWHVLTGYAPNVPGELALQGFTYGQLGMPSALMISTLGLVRAPQAAPDVLDGYKRGKAARFLPTVRFEDLWELPLVEVRERLGIKERRAS
jgi:ubiquinone biosynthesis protein COQ4